MEKCHALSWGNKLVEDNLVEEGDNGRPSFVIDFSSFWVADPFFSGEPAGLTELIPRAFSHIYANISILILIYSYNNNDEKRLAHRR